MPAISRALTALALFLVLPTLHAQTCEPSQPPKITIWAPPPDGPLERETIRIASAGDALQRREALIRAIWNHPVLPDAMPSRVERGVAPDALATPPPNLDRTDRLTVDMDFLRATVYVFRPRVPSRTIVLYHAPHEPAVEGSKFADSRTIERLVADGFIVAAFSMPLTGINTQHRPTLTVPNLGTFRMSTHEQFRYVDAERGGHSLRYFLEPVVVALNYLRAEKRERDVAMIGLSGGAWATTVLAAIDTRIDRSYPVAGSVPFHLRWYDFRSWGDYEQNLPEIYRIANYSELYVLGSSGRNRAQVQVLNKYDNCCFAFENCPDYATTIRAHGGNFALVLDDTHIGHGISPCTLEMIIDDLRGRATVCTRECPR